LFQALLNAKQEGAFPLSWLNYFPQETIPELSDDQVGELLEASVSRQSTIGDNLLMLVVERLARPSAIELLATVTRLGAKHPAFGVSILERCLDREQLRLKVSLRLFPALLQAQGDPSRVIDILDRLATDQELLDGGDLLALCLDNWAALRKDMVLWSWLREPRIEGSRLVSIADKWLQDLEKPHRIDMMVVILRDVRQRSSPKWLTPLSLEVQALCEAGRFEEAEKIAGLYYDLSIKRQDAQDYIIVARRRVQERKVAYESEFERLWRLVNTIR
jgi:hypothetical protein